MIIGGFQSFSLNDYPGEIASVIFTQGCNFRCGYCHNPQLIPSEKTDTAIEEEYLFEYLDERKDKITAIVISGGEPTLQPDLNDFLFKLKALNLKIKLDTNGSNPDVLKKILNDNLVDFIAMDIKSDFETYQSIINVNISAKRINRSIKLIQDSGIDFQFRTTILKNYHSKDNILEIRKCINSELHIQNFEPNSGNLLDTSLNNQNRFSDREFTELKNLINSKK